jgi:hypothetical protein
LILPSDITNIAYVNPTTQRITLSTAYATAPYIAGQQIVITGVVVWFPIGKKGIGVLCNLIR